LKMSMMFFLLHQNSCWSQSAPLFSAGSDGEAGKMVGQLGLPNGVKSLMRRSPKRRAIASRFRRVECLVIRRYSVTLQDFSPPAAAHPGLEWLRAVPP
jgi:hypothetical protein